MTAAHEILSDPEKRSVYDERGLAGLANGGDGDDSAEDLMSQLFGRGRGGARKSGTPKGEDMVQAIGATLEDLYNGKTNRVTISRSKPCTACEGRGGKAGAEKSCSDCNGHGVRVMLRQIGPGMVQQMRVACPACNQTGKCIDERDKCRSCRGKKVYDDRKELEVLVEKGMKEGSKIKFSGEADDVPGTIAGDVIFVVKEREHAVFKRKGSDLLCVIKLQLSDALCGFVKTITHLDGRILKIESAPGQIVKQDSTKVIQGEGMPFQGNPFTKGRLFVHFKIDFPTTLPLQSVTALSAALPRVQPPTLSGEEEECLLSKDVDISQFGQGDGARSTAYDEDGDDEEGGHGGQRVQCGQA